MKLIYITLIFSSIFFHDERDFNIHVANENFLGCNCDFEDGEAREECLRLCFKTVQLQIKANMSEQRQILSKPVVLEVDNARYQRLRDENDALDRKKNEYKSLWLNERTKRLKAEKEAADYKAKYDKSEAGRIAARKEADRLEKELKLEKMKSDSLQTGWNRDKYALRFEQFSKGYTLSPNKTCDIRLGEVNKDITLSCAPVHGIWNNLGNSSPLFIVCEVTELCVDQYNDKGKKIEGGESLAFKLNYAKNSSRYWSVDEYSGSQTEPITLAIKPFSKEEEEIIPFRLKDAPKKGHVKVVLSLEVYFAKKRLEEEVLEIGNLMKVSPIKNYICSMEVDRNEFSDPVIEIRN